MIALIFGSWPGSSETARQGLHTVKAELCMPVLSILLKQIIIPRDYAQVVTQLTLGSHDLQHELNAQPTQRLVSLL